MTANGLRRMPQDMPTATQERDFVLWMRDMTDVADQITVHTTELVSLMQRIVGVNEPPTPQVPVSELSPIVPSAKEQLDAVKFRLAEQSDRMRNALNAINQYI